MTKKLDRLIKRLNQMKRSSHSEQILIADHLQGLVDEAEDAEDAIELVAGSLESLIEETTSLQEFLKQL